MLWEEIVCPFALSFVVELVAILMAWKSRVRRRAGLSRWPVVQHLAAGLWSLPIFLWCGQATLRTIGFFDQLAWSHGPPPQDLAFVLFNDFLALGILLGIQTIGALITGSGGTPLGLKGPVEKAVRFAVLATILDGFLLLLLSTPRPGWF